MSGVSDGLWLCEGNTVIIPFCHQDLEFSVEKVVPVWGQSLDSDVGMRLSVSRNLTGVLEESLRLDMSGLRISPSQSPAATRAAPSHLNIVTSTPGMEVDESKIHSRTESICRRLARTEIDSEGGASLERQLQGLDLEGEEEEEAGEGEGDLVEVVVCKVTAKTEVVFVGGGEKNRNQVSPSLPLVRVNESILQGQVVRMGEIGGLSSQKQLLRELVLYPLSHPSISGETTGAWLNIKNPSSPPEGVQFPRGVLLHGPAGVGKSLLTSALSSETSANVLSLSPSDLPPRYDTSSVTLAV